MVYKDNNNRWHLGKITKNAKCDKNEKNINRKHETAYVQNYFWDLIPNSHHNGLPITITRLKPLTNSFATIPLDKLRIMLYKRLPNNEISCSACWTSWITDANTRDSQLVTTPQPLTSISCDDANIISTEADDTFDYLPQPVIEIPSNYNLWTEQPNT